MIYGLLRLTNVQWKEREWTVARRDPTAFAAAMCPDTKLVLLESPSNLGMQLTDLRLKSHPQHRLACRQMEACGVEEKLAPQVPGPLCHMTPQRP